MKKLFKLLVIIISICVIFYIINCFRNYFIINNLSKISKNYTIPNNYKLNQTSLSIANDNTEWKVESEYYFKDNIYLYKNNTLLSQNSNKEINRYGVWHNNNSNEHIEFLYDDNNNLIKDELIDKENLEIPPLSTFTFCNYNISNIDFLKTIIYKEQELYKIITLYKDYKSTIWVNNNSGIIEKLEYIYNNLTYSLTNIYEENVVDEEIIIKPNF